MPQPIDSIEQSAQASQAPMLHVGLLSLNRRFLLSDDAEHPNLFNGELERDSTESYEGQAWRLLAQRGISASRDRLLVANETMSDRGYLLRESQRIDPDEHGLAVYSSAEVDSFLSASRREDIQTHFLRQIVQHMKPRP